MANWLTETIKGIRESKEPNIPQLWAMAVIIWVGCISMIAYFEAKKYGVFEWLNQFLNMS